MASALANRLTCKLPFHIEPSDRYAHVPKGLESRAKDDISPAEPYVEGEPTIAEWLRECVPTKSDATGYVRELFPFVHWIRRYNLRWLLGDAMAGLTVGFVVVPQAMAYAFLAQLSPEYGLFTSFAGFAVYWIFGTSRDVVVGPTAVGSLLVGDVITHIQAVRPGEYTGGDIARALTFVIGCVSVLIGLLRLGWIVDFIPYIPISAFTTSASITIMLTQAPATLGITSVNTRDPPYLVVVNTLKSLGETRIDAAIGLSCIVLLFFVRDGCAAMASRQPQRKRMWDTIASLRQVSAMVIYTLISFLVNRNRRNDPEFHLVGDIQSGFSHAGVPRLSTDLIGLIFPELPALLIILIIEHIAIAKSLGRLTGYKICSSQEILSQGASNIVSPFLGGYAGTGSFGASGVLSKAGVRTPVAGLFSAMVLVLALYVLTGVFFFIPKAALAALIIHAVSNLMTSPRIVIKYGRLSPVELLIWIVGVVLAFFQSLEISMYVTIALSLVLLLVRMSRSRGRFMGSVKVHDVRGGGSGAAGCGSCGERSPRKGNYALTEEDLQRVDCCLSAGKQQRRIFVPLDRRDGSNPKVEVNEVHPGVIVYRFPEGFNYTNHAHHVEDLQSYVLANTRRTTEEQPMLPSDRLWCDSPPSEWSDDTEYLPNLRAIVLDFSSVNNLDITAVQGLSHLRATLDAHAAPDVVEWHFACVQNRWTRRTLAIAGFGYPSEEAMKDWKGAYTLGPLERRPPSRYTRSEKRPVSSGRTTLWGDEEREEAEQAAAAGKSPGWSPSSRMGTVFGVNRPYFHSDLTEAVEVAVRNVQERHGVEDTEV
ncbi:related to sulfate permease II [Cephalotrichum gorgonifer]|uniref:Related to sulfate permease II n=1 Tax=Cephalotrichum gorgonifer TaxID=2041049 RepID=A0AAE8SUM5_9PEZI|nr:related to sulfate permease II [Cephalotrichum gorgonifer]